jgi:hypothetical protein
LTLPWRAPVGGFQTQNLSSKLKVAGSNPAGVATIIKDLLITALAI